MLSHDEQLVLSHEQPSLFLPDYNTGTGTLNYFFLVKILKKNILFIYSSDFFNGEFPTLLFLPYIIDALELSMPHAAPRGSFQG